MSINIWVDTTYSKPKALLLACKQAGGTAPCQFTPMVRVQCCVCMEDLADKDTKFPSLHLVKFSDFLNFIVSFSQVFSA
jgi:hypothetical protein